MEQSRIEQTLDQPLSVQDQELFDRVWQRIMSERNSTQLPSTPPPGQLTPEQPQSPPLPPLPAAPDLPGTGNPWLEYAPVLQEMAEGSFGAWQSYQALARRAQGNAARQLRTLAADQQQGLRQLSTAYFLLTGEHLSHTPRSGSSAGPIDGLLRDLFLREKRWKTAYAHRASQTRDECLSELFSQMAQRCQVHMDAIRRILEGM